MSILAQQSWPGALRAASDNFGLQILTAAALLPPLGATIGQYWASGFFRQSALVELLFWPGAEWRLAISLNGALIMALIACSYLASLACLLKRRTLFRVMAIGIGAVIAAQLAGRVVGGITGWREQQALNSLHLAGKANQAILSLWHNPIWEEAVFRGLPLMAMWLVARRWPRFRKTATWIYFLLPSAVFAAYHVPQHGYIRIADTLVLSLVFAWLALRFGFASVIALHCIFDALMVMSLWKLPGIPRAEVQWLADHSGLVNSAFSVAALGAAALATVLIARSLWRLRSALPPAAAFPRSIQTPSR